MRTRIKHLLIGMGRLFDFTGSYNRASWKCYVEQPAWQRDGAAIGDAWASVGSSIQSAMKTNERR